MWLLINLVRARLAAHFFEGKRRKIVFQAIQDLGAVPVQNGAMGVVMVTCTFRSHVFLDRWVLAEGVEVVGRDEEQNIRTWTTCQSGKYI
jgi:hypothetical protein